MKHFLTTTRTFRNNSIEYWQNLPLATKGIIVIMLPLAVLLASLTSIYSREQQLTDLENQLKIALQNQRDIETVHTKLLLASTGVRDYLLTGDKIFLTTFNNAKKSLPAILTKLSQQLESQAQKNRISHIATLAQKNISRLDQLAADESEIASDALIVEFKSQVNGLRIIRDEIEQLSVQEAQLIASEQQKVKLQRQQNITITLSAAIAGIFGSVFAVWVFSGTIVKRVKLLRDSAGHLARAEALDLPSKSNDELGQLSDELDHASTLLAKNIYDARQAKHEAEQANKEKSMFLSRTSHELRTPLNAILGFTQLLEDELQAGKQKDNLSMIKGAGEHLLKLINEVLDIAKIESGETRLTLAPTPINDLLKEAIRYISPMGKIRDIYIEYNIADDLVALADRQKLLQVILNLLSNALKYGPVNSIVQLTAYQKNDVVIIEVFDTGSGITQNLKKRLFTAFDRLGAEQSKIEGTGLGLALSKQLLLAMQGTIHVADDKSLFWVELKTATLVNEPLKEVAPPEAAPVTQALSPGKKDIIYVEDNVGNRALVEAILKRYLHLKLHFANSVKEAKILLSQLDPALIIIDLHLPDGSGEELVHYIKANAPLSDLPIMILSADAMPDTISRLEKAGVDSYLTKPLDITKFSNQILAITE